MRRVLLLGGGGPINEFILAELIRADKRQPTLDTGSWHGRFRPIIGSWSVQEINPQIVPQLQDAPLGLYRVAPHDGRKIFIQHTKEKFAKVIFNRVPR